MVFCCGQRDSTTGLSSWPSLNAKLRTALLDLCPSSFLEIQTLLASGRKHRIRTPTSFTSKDVIFGIEGLTKGCGEALNTFSAQPWKISGMHWRLQAWLTLIRF